MSTRTLLTVAILLAIGPLACTVARLIPGQHPPHLQADGLVQGYAAVGMPSDTELLEVGVLRGRGEGALLRVSFLRLIRFEIGALGLSLGLGPVDFGVGVLFYEPRMPVYPAPRSPELEEWVEASSEEDGLSK